MITEMNRKLKGKTYNEKFLWKETMAKFLMKTFHEMIYEYIFSCQTYFSEFNK